jgi:hypothetical protein
MHAERYIRFQLDDKNREELIVQLWRNDGWRFAQVLRPVVPFPPAEPLRSRVAIAIIRKIKYFEWETFLSVPFFDVNDSPGAFLEACRLAMHYTGRFIKNLLGTVTFGMNVTDSEGNTPLHCWFASSAWRDPTIFLAFLERGADIHATNKFGQTCFDVMINCASWLKDSGETQYPIDKLHVIAELSDAMRSCRGTPFTDLVNELIAVAPEEDVDARTLREALGFGLMLGCPAKRDGIPHRAEEFSRISGSREATFNVRRTPIPTFIQFAQLPLHVSVIMS